MTFLSPFLEAPIITFLAITKNGANLFGAFISIIVETNASKGKWNRDTVAPFDNFVYTCANFYIFVKNMQKMIIDYVHCPKFWRPSLRSIGQKNWVKLC